MSSDLRHFMRLVEDAQAAPPTFFWGSKKPFKIGSVLKGRSPAHQDADSRKVEAALTMFAGDDPFGRRCVYMVDQPDADHIERVGGYTDFVYRVQPVGEVRRYDVRWWLMLLVEIEGAPPARKSEEYRQHVLTNLQPLALAYFSGEATDRPLWEFCTASARIVEDVTEQAKLNY